MNQDVCEQAMRCLRSMEALDFNGVRAMCTDTATVWHNDGKGEQTIDEKLEELASLSPSVESLRYDVTRRFGKADEVFHQQTLHLATTDGICGEFHAMMYFRFEGGLIDRIEEYGYTVAEPVSGRRP